MTIKPHYLLRSLLSLPYLAWCMAALLVYLFQIVEGDAFTIDSLFDWLAGFASIYILGIVYWGIPYSILALGLFLWSFKKPAGTFFTVLLFSPFLLSVLMGIEVALVSFFPVQPLSLETVMSLLSLALIVIVPTLVIGYGFVAVGAVAYKVIERLNLIGVEGVVK